MLEMQTRIAIVTQANSGSAILQPNGKLSVCFVKEFGLMRRLCFQPFLYSYFTKFDFELTICPV